MELVGFPQKGSKGNMSSGGDIICLPGGQPKRLTSKEGLSKSLPRAKWRKSAAFLIVSLTKIILFT